MNAIVEEALASYFAGKSQDASLRLSAVERLCSRPFDLSHRRLNALLEEDVFYQ
jgi:hypothetical protein